MAVAVTVFASFAAALPAFADTAASPAVPTPQARWNGQMGTGQNGQMRGQRMGGGMMKPAVIGTVTSVSGSTIVLSGREGFGTSTPATSFTVDATNAKISKNNATSTISNVAAGDTLFVQGTITGSNVAATMIRDGVMMRGQGMRPGMNQGNGQTPYGTAPQAEASHGFFGGIGQFFKHLFGF